MEEEKISRIVRLLKKAKSILFITGAGISADSGLPTYRGVGGLYNHADTEEGISIETALAGETLAARPEITWKYISRIEEKCRSARFNRAHQVIAQMQEHFPRLWVLTQNIDGFHRDAGSRNIIDIHGVMHQIYCSQCGWRSQVKDYAQLEMPPPCPRCRRILRPDVVFFNELLPQEKLLLLDRQLQEGFDIYFTVGTTSVFPYIREPILLARHLGRPTIEINPCLTEVSAVVEIRLAMRAAEALERIWADFNQEQG